MIVVDTNIVIAYLGHEEGVVVRIRQVIAEGEEIVVPTVVVAETLAYPGIDDETIERTRKWFSEIIVMSLDLEIAERAAALRRETGLKIIDSIVIATALENHAKLASRDAAFKKIEGLSLLAW